MEDKLYWVWLSLVYPGGSDKGNQVVREFGPPEAFYALSAGEMAQLGFLRREHIETAKNVGLDRAEEVLDNCKRLGIQVVAYGDPDYPERLRNIFAPPMVLYALGGLSGLDEEAAIAVVGTRRETDYSNSLTGWLSKGMAEAGAVIVSGCAEGIDSAALVGALQGGGRTVGVLPCGLDVDYPRASHGLKRQMLRQGGALVSELPPGTPVLRGVFPKRNRIMAGLSLGVLITHAPERSGALITANHALENGRDVFCVPPYSVFDPQYYGVVELLRQGAAPVFAPEDVLGCYAGQFPNKLNLSHITGDYVRQRREDGKTERIQSPKPKQAPVSPPDPQQQKRNREEADLKFSSQRESFDENQELVYNKLEQEPQYLNDLAARTGLPTGVLLSVLTELELAGVAQVCPGSRYRLG